MASTASSCPASQPTKFDSRRSFLGNHRPFAVCIEKALPRLYTLDKVAASIEASIQQDKKNTMFESLFKELPNFELSLRKRTADELGIMVFKLSHMVLGN